MSASAAIPWWKTYDPNLDVAVNPTIKTLYSRDFSQGFVMTGVSDIREFNTFQTTAIGARFDSAGDIQWAAFLNGGPGSRLQRVEALSDMEHFFAAYAASGKIRAGVYNGLTMEKRFAHEFDVRSDSLRPAELVIGRFGGDVIGIAQHLGEESVHVMILDEHGNILADRDYGGLGVQTPFEVEPDLRFQRLPDETGFLLVVPGHVVCLNNNGDIRWSREGPFHPGFFPSAIGPDGSVVFTVARFTRLMPGSSQTFEGGTVMVKLNSDGSFAWVRQIDDIMPEEDMFLMGRNPIYDGENIWLVANGIEDNPFSPLPDRTFAALVRIDAATGDILAQADISIEDNLVVGEFAGWTGTHAFFSIDSYTPPSTTWRQGNLLKVDGNLENPELLKIHTDVETTRVSYDALSDSLLYTSTEGNGRWIRASSLDAATLEPGGLCQPHVPIEPVDFTYAPASRQSVPVTDMPPIEASTVTVSEAGTVLTPTDISLAPLTFGITDGCGAGPPVFFADWASEIFGDDAGNPAVAGPGVDLTGDGVTNLQAFVFGLDPWASNSPSMGILPVRDDTGFAVTFRVRGNIPFGTLRIEGSYDMVDWTAPLQIEASSPDADGMRTVTVRLGESSTEAEKGFVRIVVVEVEP